MPVSNVETLAQVADLPLAADRVKAVSEILAVWLPAANALSVKMSAPEFMAVTPITGVLQIKVSR